MAHAEDLRAVYGRPTSAVLEAYQSADWPGVSGAVGL